MDPATKLDRVPVTVPTQDVVNKSITVSTNGIY